VGGLNIGLAQPKKLVKMNAKCFLAPLTHMPIPMTTPATIDFSKLSITERIDLIGDIWDSIIDEAPDDEITLSQAEKAELHRRVAAYRADPSRGIPWEQVRAELFGELG
jgi:putative addiction module component (TIGR02574 family)